MTSEDFEAITVIADVYARRSLRNLIHQGNRERMKEIESEFALTLAAIRKQYVTTENRVVTRASSPLKVEIIEDDCEYA